MSECNQLINFIKSTLRHRQEIDKGENTARKQILGLLVA